MSKNRITEIWHRGVFYRGSIRDIWRFERADRSTREYGPRQGSRLYQQLSKKHRAEVDPRTSTSTWRF